MGKVGDLVGKGRYRAGKAGELSPATLRKWELWGKR